MMGAKNADGRSDLWSLGVVAYHAVTGRVPFDAETIGALCVAIERGTFPPASRVRPGLPESLDAWFEKALARSPEARFSTAREMSDAFEAALRGEAPSRRRAWIAAAAVVGSAAVVILAVVVVAAAWSAQKRNAGESSSVQAGEPVASSYAPPPPPPPVSISVQVTGVPSASSSSPASSSSAPPRASSSAKGAPPLPPRK
jgi:serine/threonine protein kinase